MTGQLAPAFDALDDARAALAKLEKTCCVPERSPRMAALAGTIDQARTALGDTSSPGAVTAHLEDAGAQVGRLQVGCCAENRMPLYARILEDLTTAQLTLDRARGGMDH